MMNVVFIFYALEGIFKEISFLFLMLIKLPIRFILKSLCMPLIYIFMINYI